MAELDTDMDFASMKVNDLKRELKNRGLSVTGNKTELIERLQMSLMGGNDSDILADATDLLEGGDDDLGEDSIGATLESDEAKKEEAAAAAATASKKKVAIKRDSALPVIAAPEPKVAKTTIVAPVTAKVEEKKTEAATTVVEAKSTTEAVTEVTASGDKPIKAMTDAERAAIRAARFGGAAAVAGDDKKLERAKRFGLPVTAASNGKTSKIGAVPSVDLDTLKKRAERFGQTTSNTMKKLELDDKIKKRAERFGEVKNGDGPTAAKKTKIEVNKSLIEPKVDPAIEEKLKKRAERFASTKS